MLQKINKLVDSYGIPVILALCIIIFFRTCSTSSSVAKIEKKVNQLDSASSTLSKEQVDSIIKTRLYEFLIFEEDLDRGKTSLSDIRIKITGNEK